MNYATKLFVKIASEEFDLPDPVYEIGSLQVPGQEDIADLRKYFSGKTYTGCDLRAGIGVDRIEDVHKLSLDNGVAGTVLLMNTLEHVENCWQAMSEVYRVLKEDGVVILSLPMFFPVHEFPADYWRFTPEGLDVLLKKFPTRIIGWQGTSKFPMILYGVGFKSMNVLGIEESYKVLSDRFATEMRRSSIKIPIKPLWPFIWASRNSISYHRVSLKLSR